MLHCRVRGDADPIKHHRPVHPPELLAGRDGGGVGSLHFRSSWVEELYTALCDAVLCWLLREVRLSQAASIWVS